MGKADWVWMAHPGHFVGGSKCQFRMNTYVNGHVVSTLGEYVASNGKMEAIGGGKDYETMVFRAVPQPFPDGQCCPWEADVMAGAVDLDRYDSRNDAASGHYAMCEKWDIGGQG